MTERERLIELLLEWGNNENDGVRAESIADYLLANGVIVLPVKVGDTEKIKGCDKMKNSKIRNALKDANIKQWELAEMLGISETTLCVKLRRELPDSEQEQIMKLIYEKGGNEK